MNESLPSLDDLALLLLVAECGSLTAAAKRSGTSLPTLSRRMTGLETQTGRQLFLRGRAGYALTSEGRALAAEVSGLATVKNRVARHLTQNLGPRRVRITAGFWTSRDLAGRMMPDASGAWLPEFVPSNASLDLARREADIGIRNRPPDHPWLARQKTRDISYAVYGLPDTPEQFVTLPHSTTLPPSQRWVHETRGDHIATTASDTRVCLDLARSGFGRVVVPCFVGDVERTLVRLSDPIPELTHDEWLVSHHEARHDPPIRDALKALQRLLSNAPE